MRRSKLFLLSMCLAASLVPAVAQVTPIVQQSVVSTVAPPANTPLFTSQLNCVAGSTGLAANTYLIAYTYTGPATSSETKASSDASATTIVTCPANGVLTIPSPPLPPGCNPATCTGWRPYAIASSSGTGAELLQTVAATNCTLSTLSNLTSCAFNSSFVETSLGAGAAEPTNPTLFLAPVSGTTMGAFLPISETGLGIVTHALNWAITGTAATCTIAIQTSPDNITYTTVGAAQTCTASGAFQLNATTANFVRINLTAFTATGANVPSLSWSLVEYPPSVPTVSVVACGSVAACAQGTGLFTNQIKVVTGTCTLAANSCAVTGMPAFSSTASYGCYVTDQTTPQLVKAANVSATAFTITDTVGATDVVNYVCIGT